jgi:hypothetical protein
MLGSRVTIPRDARIVVPHPTVRAQWRAQAISQRLARFGGNEKMGNVGRRIGLRVYMRVIQLVEKGVSR